MTAFEAIRLKIREELNRITDECINGSCQDHSQYMRVVGTAYGLALAEDYVKEIEKRLYNEDDEEEIVLQ